MPAGTQSVAAIDLRHSFVAFDFDWVNSVNLTTNIYNKSYSFALSFRPGEPAPYGSQPLSPPFLCGFIYRGFVSFVSFLVLFIVFRVLCLVYFVYRIWFLLPVQVIVWKDASAK